MKKNKFDRYVWVQRDAFTLQPMRIYKNAAAFRARPCLAIVDHIPYADAVKAIRHRIFVRSKGLCEMCGSVVLESTGHMHERLPRGRGGEISIANSIFICVVCHKGEHKERNPQWRQS